MKKTKYMTFIAVCGIAMLIGGCGKDGNDAGGQQQGSAAQSSSEADATQAPAGPQTSAPAPGAPADGSAAAPTTGEMAAVAEQNRQILTQMNQGKQIVAVTPDTLKGTLPATLAGMTQTGASAEQNQAMGINLTHAEGEYAGQNDASLSLQVTDVGNLSGPMKMGMVGWTMAQYDRKTDSGYEKTGTYSGYKGMEEYDNESKSGTIRVFVADRFVIELSGSNTSMDTIKQALGQIDFKKLTSLVSGS